MITVTNLRKIFTEQGIKGASKWKREDFDSAIIASWYAATAEDEARKPKAPEAPKPTTPKKGICEDCGRKVNKKVHSTLCPPCYDYAGWENTHSDSGHEALLDSTSEQDEDQVSCPVCHPELDPRTERKTGKSRAGMVILAKGDEVHKSSLFKRMAEAKGWKVVVTEIEISEDETRYVAVAEMPNFGEIHLAWNGRAYDYANSGATLNGKARKVRNLKEATRLI